MLPIGRVKIEENFYLQLFDLFNSYFRLKIGCSISVSPSSILVFSQYIFHYLFRIEGAHNYDYILSDIIFVES
jgi:hypothetical protein